MIKFGKMDISQLEITQQLTKKIIKKKEKIGKMGKFYQSENKKYFFVDKFLKIM
jgi:hypothetical protein